MSHSPTPTELDLKHYKLQLGVTQPPHGEREEPVAFLAKAEWVRFATLHQAAAEWACSDEKAKRIIKEHGLPHFVWWVKQLPKPGRVHSWSKRTIMVPAEVIWRGAQIRDQEARATPKVWRGRQEIPDAS